MAKVCDHTSVGVLIWWHPENAEEKLLLIERQNGRGLAPPAGHLDGDKDSGMGGKREVREEVGLAINDLELVWCARANNSCSREGGTWHAWDIYQTVLPAPPPPELKIDPAEVKSYRWVTRKELDGLAVRTKKYLHKQISEEEWRQSPGLEPIWLLLLIESGYLFEDWTLDLE